MAEFEVKIRSLTDADIEHTGTEDFANTADGGAVLEVGGVVVAVLNEYGTAFVSTTDMDSDELTDEEVKEKVEDFAEVAMELWLLAQEATAL